MTKKQTVTIDPTSWESIEEADKEREPEKPPIGDGLLTAAEWTFLNHQLGHLADLLWKYPGMRMDVVRRGNLGLAPRYQTPETELQAMRRTLQADSWNRYIVVSQYLKRLESVLNVAPLDCGDAA